MQKRPRPAGQGGLEVELQKNALHYQRKVALETVYREESADCIVPDSQPDIARILDVSAIAFIRDREADHDEVKLRCSIRAVVLYAAEDSEKVYAVEVPISYTHAAQMRGVEPRDELVCGASVVTADARILNPRKVSVRVNTAYPVCVYRQGEEEIACAAAEEGCCIQTETKNLSYTTAVSVKNFTLVEDLDLDAAMPSAERVYCASFDLMPQDAKILAGRATVRAQANVKALYQSTEGTLCTLERSFEFTQSADMPAGGDESMAAASFYLRSFELDCAVDMSGESRYLSLSAGITMNVEAVESREFEILQDLYGLKRELSFTCRELDLTPPGEDCTVSRHFSETIDTAETVQSVLYCRICPDFSFEKTGEEELSTGATAYLVYKAEDGQIYGISKRLMLRFPVPQADVSGAHLAVGEASASVSAGGGITLDFDAVLSCRTAPGGKVSVVEEAQWGEEYPQDPRGLSAILTRVAGDESVWEIARRYHTTSEAIEAANRGVDISAGGNPLILIPL